MTHVTVVSICDFCTKKIERQFVCRVPDDVDINDFWADEDDDFYYLTDDDYEDKVFCSDECYRAFLIKMGETEKLDRLSTAIWVA